MPSKELGSDRVEKGSIFDASQYEGAYEYSRIAPDIPYSDSVKTGSLFDDKVWETAVEVKFNGINDNVTVGG